MVEWIHVVVARGVNTRDEEGEKRVIAILSEKRAVNTRARKPMVWSLGEAAYLEGVRALVCFLGSEARAKVKRVAEEKERRGMMAEPEL